MVAIDSNIIVRFLTGDDEKQFSIAKKIFSTNEIYISNTVILETEWVLRFAYKFNQPDINDAFNKLFGLKNIHLSDPNLLAAAITWHKSGMDFADALHLAYSQKHSDFYTFDEKFIKKTSGQSKCIVSKPD